MSLKSITVYKHSIKQMSLNLFSVSKLTKSPQQTRINRKFVINKFYLKLVSGKI